MPEMVESYRWLACAALVVAIVSGCAPAPIRLDSAEIARLKDEREIRAVRYEPASLSFRSRLGAAQLPGILALASLGADIADSARGPQLMKEYGLTDPAGAVQERLLAALAGELGLQKLRTMPDPLTSDELDALKTAVGTGPVLDVKTLAWNFQYDQNSFSGYLVYYSARGRLVRLDPPRVVWQSTCYLPGKQSLPVDQFTANNGALLKVTIAERVEQCVQFLRDELLGRSKAGS